MNRTLRNACIFALVMAFVAAAGWFGRKAYKRSIEHRLVARAKAYLEKDDFRNAGLCLQRALQVNPMSVDSSKLMGDLLEASGSLSAINWRIRTAQLRTNNADFRFEWARTALRMQESRSAAQALSGLDEKSKSRAEFHKLNGALAWQEGNADQAEQQYAEALHLEPTNQANILNLNTVRLVSTNQAIADAARASLEQIPTNSPLRTTALQHLITDATAHTNFSKAINYSRELVSTPAAGFGLKLEHLQLLKQTGDANFNTWFSSLTDTASKSAPDAFLFGRWMASAEGPGQALRWLLDLPPQIQTNQPVPLVIADCYVFLKDWEHLAALVEKQDWGEANYFRLALDSLAKRSQHTELAADVAWRKALRQAEHRLDGLSRLAQLTAKWGWKAETIQVLLEITSQFPKEKWAADELISQFYASGKSRELAEFITKVYEAHPSDPFLKNNLATISLLRKSDLSRAYRLAREAYDSAPDNPFFISTYAYSLVLQQKTDEAIKIVSTLKAEHLKVPSIAAYYGVIEAQAGNKHAARAPLELAASARLLPEEEQIVQTAKAGL